MSCEFCKDKCNTCFHLNEENDISDSYDDGSPIYVSFCYHNSDDCDYMPYGNYCEECGRLLDNKALTIDELMKMDGEPVWIVDTEDCERYFWVIWSDRQYQSLVDCAGVYGVYWLAYRQKVDE